jgi:hypothetical protein
MLRVPEAASLYDGMTVVGGGCLAAASRRAFRRETPLHRSVFIGISGNLLIPNPPRLPSL